MKSRLTALILASVSMVSIAEPNEYADDLKELHRVLGENSATLGLHSTDWQCVGEELLPKTKEVGTDEEFAWLCMEMIARLNDSHAILMAGSCKVPQIGLPQWDAGFSCLKDAEGDAVVYYVAEGGSADRKGVEPGMVVVEINGVGVDAVIQKARCEINKCIGYSTCQYLDYHTYRWFVRQHTEGEKVEVVLRDAKGRKKNRVIQASSKVGYVPRLPVPIDGISDGGGSVQWKKLKNNIGYIYVRRIKKDLETSLEEAVEDLKKTDGIIIDMRGNSGGGFNAKTAHCNFDLESLEESKRTKYRKPLAILISPRCISAGEGWASWFVAKKRGRFFGEPTAGGSGRKTTYTLPSGRFKVRYVVKPYKGYLDRYIEGRGLEPDVPVIQTAKDLTDKRDTVLEAAREYLLSL